MAVTQHRKNRKISSPSVAEGVEQDLRERIAGGVFRPGAMLPSRKQLAIEYGVALLTVEQAIKMLVSDGILRAENGRGTFVVDRPMMRPAQVRNVSGAPFAAPEPATALRPAGRDIEARSTSIRSATIGIVAAQYPVSDDHLSLNNFWVRLMVHSMEKVFSDDGKTTHFFNRVAGDGVTPLTEAITEALAAGVDALAVIVFGPDPQDLDRSISQLDPPSVPIVYITSGDLKCPVSHVSLDNHSAGYQAATHLLRSGHRALMFIAPFSSAWVEERLEGVHSAVEHAGLPKDAVRVFPPLVGHWAQEEDPQLLGYEAGKRAFAEVTVPSGVICVSDGVAIGFRQAAAEAGAVIGEDFALISFDDHPDARSLGLTTLRPPMEDMAHHAARMLIRALHGEEMGLRVRLRWQLIPRASARAPHRSSAADRATA